MHLQILIRMMFRITNLNTSTATNKNGVSSTSTTATLDKGVPYSWKVTSKNTTTTTTTPSDLWKFYLAGDGVVNYAPFPADLKTLRLDQLSLLVKVKRRLLGMVRILIVETRLVIRFM